MEWMDGWKRQYRIQQTINAIEANDCPTDAGVQSAFGLAGYVSWLRICYVFYTSNFARPSAPELTVMAVVLLL